jgi:hypothetical protein
LAVEIILQNRVDTPVGTRPDDHGPVTGSFEAVVSVVFAQAHEAQTGAEPLLGKRP